MNIYSIETNETSKPKENHNEGASMLKKFILKRCLYSIKTNENLEPKGMYN